MKAQEFNILQKMVCTSLGLELHVMKSYRSSIYDMRIREIVGFANEADYTLYHEHLLPWFANLWRGVDIEISMLHTQTVNEFVIQGKNWDFYCSKHHYRYYAQFTPTREDLLPLVSHLKAVNNLINDDEET